MCRLIIGFLLSIPLWSKCQHASRITATRTVFNTLIQAYANSKSAPSFTIIPLSEKRTVIARYRMANDRPVIEIDEKLINLCFSMGEDSLNALAIILSHELAHYYNDHEWCSDYAYALQSSNRQLSVKLKRASREAKIEKEAIADNHGIFYASVAGFSVLGCYNQLLDKVYAAYKLPVNHPEYPTLAERKKIARDASAKSKELYGYFKAGIKAMNDANYDEAILLFNKANSKIPYRENYNNLGVAKARKALMLKSKTYEEVHFPDRFLYPLEIENRSRLSQDDTRSLDDDRAEEYTGLLKEAKKDFQEAIRIDQLFTKGYINLACVYDLLDNPPMAIGTIKELPREEQNTRAAKTVLAIAYYHDNKIEIAERIWKELNIDK